uniref:chitinase n=1 Tax=Aegilops tauschii subsp. strangulata TaxID=200361 RepID=A0A453J353_AEGTS
HRAVYACTVSTTSVEPGTRWGWTCLLGRPDLVSTDPVVAFKTAIWFWMTPRHGAQKMPSCHAVMTGGWRPSRREAPRVRHDHQHHQRRAGVRQASRDAPGQGPGRVLQEVLPPAPCPARPQRGLHQPEAIRARRLISQRVAHAHGCSLQCLFACW